MARDLIEGSTFTLDLPICATPDPTYLGVGDDEEIPPDEPDSCQSDFTKAQYGVNLLLPHGSMAEPGYHWNGYKTSSESWRGGKIVVEVRDPQVDHFRDGQEFVANRVLTCYPGCGDNNMDDWMEAGWMEHSNYQDDQYVYWCCQAGGIALHTQYPLQTGSFYAFRSRDCAVDGRKGQCGSIYWADEWQRLGFDTGAGCFPSGTAICSVEEFTEVLSQQQTDPHPALTSAGGGGDNRIYFRNTDLRAGDGSWSSWTHSSTQSGTTPYKACPIANYYRFYAVRGEC